MILLVVTSGWGRRPIIGGVSPLRDSGISWVYVTAPYHTRSILPYRTIWGVCCQTVAGIPIPYYLLCPILQPLYSALWLHIRGMYHIPPQTVIRYCPPLRQVTYKSLNFGIHKWHTYVVLTTGSYNQWLKWHSKIHTFLGCLSVDLEHTLYHSTLHIFFTHCFAPRCGISWAYATHHTILKTPYPSA